MNHFSSPFLCFLIGFFGIIFPPELLAQRLQVVDASVAFLSHAPLGSSFTGLSDSLSGYVDLNDSTFAFTLPLNTLDTGISLRNKHMREKYLETALFPEARFRGKFYDLYLYEDEDNPLAMEGTLDVHGVEKNYALEASVFPQSDGGWRIRVDEWIVLLSDHNIDIPTLLFKKLPEDQKVSITILLYPDGKLPLSLRPEDL